MLSLYIHIPYCVGKCLYCGFFSTPYSKQQADGFIAALQREAEREGESLSGRRIGSVYLGGGTPTVLSAEQLGRVIALLWKNFTIEAGAEFTIEANPHTVTEGSLAFLLDQGVNRLSLGAQSFSDRVLQVLGRPHTAGQIHEAYGFARRVGFRNISLDLMFGIPGQSMAEWEQTLATASALGPEHISAYGLSLDEGSAFSQQALAGNFALPDDELAAAMYERAVSALRSAGLFRYEISNFALPGYECRHNKNYWDRGEYLGLGPGAFSFVSGRRYATIADSPEYILRMTEGKSPVETGEFADAEAAARETLLLGIRTTRGVSLARFREEHGSDLLRGLEKNIGLLKASGLLCMQEGFLKLTDRGFLLSDEVLRRLCA